MNEKEVVKAIRAALERATDVNLHSYPIHVRTRDGAYRLEGEAADIAAKRKALQIARSHAGNAPVIDDLRVRVGEHREGVALRQSVLDRLMQDSVFSGMVLSEGTSAPEGHQGDWISVDAHDGVVRLTGRVNSLSHRRLAEVLAWWTPGTADVDNRIHVEPPERDNDDEIMDAVRIVFDKEPGIDPDQVRVSCRERVITLQGTVGSEQNKRIAALDCWYIPGVHDVRNELHVG